MRKEDIISSNLILICFQKKKWRTMEEVKKGKERVLTTIPPGLYSVFKWATPIRARSSILLFIFLFQVLVYEILHSGPFTNSASILSLYLDNSVVGCGR